MSTRVRPVSPGEHEQVAALTVAVYRGEGFSGPDYEPSLRDVAGRAADATVLVAVDADELLGAVTVATDGGPWAEQATPGEAVVRMLVVAPAARGRGTGELLVRACLQAALDAGCHLVRLSSQPDMTAAHRLYGRLGFSRVPALDWSPAPDVALLAFALPLVPWCDRCGEEQSGDGHDRCRAARALEPPRFCAHCRRRMVVQVDPAGWTARCVEHGLRTA